jgi:DNA-binding winged helix-turn-helix (wHTH) protein
MTNQIYEFAPFRLDLGERRLLRAGREVELQPRLFKLLAVLVEHRGRVLSNDELMELVYGRIVGDSNIIVNISQLRKKLGDGVIETIEGRGYRFVPEVKVIDPALVPDEAEEPPPAGGALPINSRYYVARATDEEFYRALRRADSLVLIKGARQVGKTSLLARGLQRARESGAAVVLTDLQNPSKAAFASSEKLLLEWGEMIAEQLGLKTGPHDGWSSLRSAGTNFQRYLRHEVLEKISGPLVWGLDEIDRLFERDYASEIFGLFRSWHNARALEPAGPWKRLTLAIGYATEAHLFITDLNQSPFNVGLHLALADFTPEQIADLNERYGAPLTGEEELARLFALLGGQPYLAQRALYEMSVRRVAWEAIEAAADHDEGIFGDHLRRLLASLSSNPQLCDAVRSVLAGQPQMAILDFYHLRSAGVLIGDSVEDARLRCQLYARYLSKHL